MRAKKSERGPRATPLPIARIWAGGSPRTEDRKDQPILLAFSQGPCGQEGGIRQARKVGPRTTFAAAPAINHNFQLHPAGIRASGTGRIGFMTKLLSTMIGP